MQRLMLGNEAVARGAYEAGVKLTASYPGTPSTEITETMAKNPDVMTQWAPNEKVALEVAIGASVAGARALCCMKHVGLNVAADPLFTVAYTGVRGGLVIVVADDPGMHSSQNEQDSRFYARSAHVPMLEPGNSAEALEFTRRAYDISEKYDTPVFIRMNTRVSHSQSMVETGERQERELLPYVKDIQKYVMMPGMAIKRHVVVEQRDRDLAAFAEQTELNRCELRDRKIGVVTTGVVYNYVRDALPEASTFKLGMAFPLPIESLREFAAKVDKLYVCEELEPFIEKQMKAAGIECCGKELFTLQGEYSVNMIKERITGEKTPLFEKESDIPGRPPVMCPGCPHRGVYYVLNKMKLPATGDIGCYTLGALPPLSGIDVSLCMGASIGMATGMQKVSEAFSHRLVSVIGDSTFLHSGITGLMDMVYNRGNGTVLILDNSTTGMTGHQPHPGTGKDAMGFDAPAVCLEEICAAVGVKRIRVVDPFDLSALEKALAEETAAEETSVIICRRPCALIGKKKAGKPYVITDRCRTCRLCARLGCPAINSGKSMSIDATLCVGCDLCARVCPFGAIERMD